MTDPAARLAEIRERQKAVRPGAVWIPESIPQFSHPVTMTVQAGTLGGLKEQQTTAARVLCEDVPLLLDALEAVLTLAADFDAAAARNYNRANLSTSGMAASGSADAYASAARRLREALAAALNKEETTDADS